jgi:glucosyl-dolichyl phosphate glucuronosyltransferase
MALVTVAVCTWNRAKVLDRTLAHLRQLGMPPGWEWELLVVDNGSTDDTRSTAERYIGELPLRYTYESNAGISFARNCAVRHARGEIILWTDDDALPDPDWAVRMLAAFDEFSADIVIGKVVPVWEQGHPPPWFVPEFAGMYALLDLGGVPRRLTDPKQIGHNVNLGFRASVPDRIGAYREDLGVGRTGGSEDIDLCSRAYAGGLAVAYQPLAVVHHCIPPERCTKDFIRRYAANGARHHWLLLKTDLPHVPVLAGLPRYYLRWHFWFAAQWMWGLATFNPGKAFYYELKFRRLLALWRLAHSQPAQTADAGSREHAAVK